MSISSARDGMKQWAGRLRFFDWRVALVAVAACVPAAVALRIQTRHWIDVPIWDEWDTPGFAIHQFYKHALTWTDLFSQHNESRKIFPRLLQVAIAAVAGWDVRQGMVLTFLCACCISVLALVYLRKGAHNTTPSLLFAWLLINLLLFAPSQYENFLSGFIYEFLVPILCLFGCVKVNLSSRPVWWKVTLNSALALIATYTFAHGILLWLFAVPLPNGGQWRKAKWVVGWIVYVLIGCMAVGAYFIGYFKPAVAPASAGIGQWRDVAAFLIMWLGAPMRSAWVSPWLAGGIVAAMIIATAVLTLFFLAGKRSAWRSYYPWILLLGFALLSGLLTAVGRVNLGIDAVFNTRFEGFSGVRYNVTAIFAYVAAIGLLFQVWSDWLRHEVRFQTSVVVALSSGCTLLAVAWAHLYAEERTRVDSFQENRRRARAAITWIKIMPDNPEIFYAYPYPKDFAWRPLEMQQLGIINIPIAGEHLRELISAVPRRTNFDFGSLDKVEREPRGHFRFIGWARNPETNRRADYVVLGWEDSGGAFHPFTALLTGIPRWDVVQVFKAGSLKNCGFNQEIDLNELPPEANIIRGWAVDFAAKKVFPLGGAVELGRSTAR